MGAIWLLNLPTWLRDAGLDVREWKGWETRSRSSGGYDAIWAVGVHHTASQTTPDNDCNWQWHNSGDRPIGAVLLDRSGRITVGAAGATNTQGKGGPYLTSRGTIPKDQGNRYMFSIEAANNGVGETWPQVQIEAYLEMCSVLCEKLNLDPLRDVISHFEWAPGRKFDPAGNSPYATGGDLWNMDFFRRDVEAVRWDQLEPEPEPEEEEMGAYVWAHPDKRGIYLAEFYVGAGGVTWVDPAGLETLESQGVPRIIGTSVQEGGNPDAVYDNYAKQAGLT